MGYINDRVEEIKEFRDKWPDNWDSVLMDFGEDRARILDACLESKSIAEALRKLEKEGEKRSRNMANNVVRLAGRRIMSCCRTHPLEKKVKLEERICEEIERQVNDYLRQFGLELAFTGYYAYAPARRMDGKRFRDSNTIMLGM